MATLENPLKKFEGKPWSVLFGLLGKSLSSGSEDSGASRPAVKTTHTIKLCQKDMAIFGLYPNDETLELVVCNYCGDKFKMPAFAEHIRLRHVEIPSAKNICDTLVTTSVVHGPKRKELSEGKEETGDTIKTKTIEGGKADKNFKPKVKNKSSTSSTTAKNRERERPKPDSARKSSKTESHPAKIDDTLKQAKLSPVGGGKTTSEPKKKPRIEGKPEKTGTRDRSYNPDKHCGVIGKENSKPCTRSLTCKSHSKKSQRAVRGRSKAFDILLAAHIAEKESERKQNEVTSCSSPDGSGASSSPPRSCVNGDSPLIKIEEVKPRSPKVSSKSGGQTDYSKLSLPVSIKNPNILSQLQQNVGTNNNVSDIRSEHSLSLNNIGRLNIVKNVMLRPAKDSQKRENTIIIAPKNKMLENNDIDPLVATKNNVQYDGVVQWNCVPRQRLGNFPLKPSPDMEKSNVMTLSFSTGIIPQGALNSPSPKLACNNGKGVSDAVVNNGNRRDTTATPAKLVFRKKPPPAPAKPPCYSQWLPGFRKTKGLLTTSRNVPKMSLITAAREKSSVTLNETVKSRVAAASNFLYTQFKDLMAESRSPRTVMTSNIVTTLPVLEKMPAIEVQTLSVLSKRKPSFASIPTPSKKRCLNIIGQKEPVKTPGSMPLVRLSLSTSIIPPCTVKSDPTINGKTEKTELLRFGTPTLQFVTASGPLSLNVEQTIEPQVIDSKMVKRTGDFSQNYHVDGVHSSGRVLIRQPLKN